MFRNSNMYRKDLPCIFNEIIIEEANGFVFSTETMNSTNYCKHMAGAYVDEFSQHNIQNVHYYFKIMDIYEPLNSLKVKQIGITTWSQFLLPKKGTRGLNQRMTMSNNSQYRPLETAIKNGLTKELNPLVLEIINESPMHNTNQAESHFRVFIVSDKFNNLSLIKRHRLVNNTIKTSLEAAGLEFMHALSIETKTPEQWVPGREIQQSPPCLGGGRK